MKKNLFKRSHEVTLLGIAGMLLFGANSCSTMRTVFATKQDEKNTSPISNPFADYDQTSRPQGSGGTVVRTRRGDRSLEVEFPESQSGLGNMVLPVSPNFGPLETADPLARNYDGRKPVMADRELASSFPRASAENDADRRAIESTLGLMAAEQDTPRHDSSYLASMDRVKLLFKAGRYEAALIEVDDLLRLYPTNPKLYEMRGTLFDRLGSMDLALRSWNQALKLDPSNRGLRKYVERKQQIRSLATGVSAPPTRAPSSEGSSR